MSLISFTHDQDSVLLRLKILNSSVATGAGLTGLTFESAGLIIGTIIDNEATTTAYTQAAGKIETIATLGEYAAPTATKCRFKEVDATNHPGIYEIQLADARFAVASAKSLIVSISGASNVADCDALIPLTQVDPYDATTGGMTNVATAAKLLAYVQLMARSDAAIKTDNATELTEINADGGTGAGDFDNEIDSEEAIADAMQTDAELMQIALAAKYGVPVGNVYFVVEATGSDENDGKTQATAVASLSHLFKWTVGEAPGPGILNSVTGPVVVLVVGDLDQDAAGDWDHEIHRPDVRLFGVNYPLIYGAESSGACTINIGNNGIGRPLAEDVEIAYFTVGHGTSGHGITIADHRAWVHHNRFFGDLGAAASVLVYGRGATAALAYGQVRDALIEDNILHGTAAGEYGVRIGPTYAPERVIVRRNQMRNRKTFVSFEHCADCYSVDNRFFKTVAGRESILFTANAVDCFSLNDTLDGGVPDVTVGYANRVGGVPAHLLKVLAKTAGKGVVTDQDPAHHVTDYYEEDGVTQSHTETVTKAGRAIS